MKPKIEMQIQIPIVPNFLMITKTRSAIPIKDFDEKVLREVGKQWTEKLVEKAKSFNQPIQ